MIQLPVWSHMTAGLATHDRLECTGIKDNQISVHLEYLLPGLFVSV